MKNFVPAASKSYEEIYQDSDLKYAFAIERGDDIIQVHDFVMCRDFFNEAIYASKLDVDCPAIWGFKYPAKEMPVDLETTRMILKGADFENLLAHLPLLNDFERSQGWQETSLEKIPDTNHFYLTGSDVWVRGGMPISLYTHILRALYQYRVDADNLFDFLTKVADEEGNAAKYQKTLNTIGIDKLLTTLDKVFLKDHLPIEGMTTITSVGNIHDNSGMVSFCNAVTSGKDNCSGMYKKELAVFRELTAGN